MRWLLWDSCPGKRNMIYIYVCMYVRTYVRTYVRMYVCILYIIIYSIKIEQIIVIDIATYKRRRYIFKNEWGKHEKQLRSSLGIWLPWSWNKRRKSSGGMLALHRLWSSLLKYAQMKCRMMHSVSSRPLPSPSSRASRTFSHELLSRCHTCLSLSLYNYICISGTHTYIYVVYIYRIYD